MEHINNNGFNYVDLELPSGTLWATCNIGASKPYENGLYFQWGSIEGNKERVDIPKSKWKYYNSTKQVFTKYTTTDAPLELDDDAAYKIMRGDWHIPSTNQIQELFDNTVAKWTSMENVLGVMFTSKKDESKFIFIPSNINCALWASETNSKNIEFANVLNINPFNLNIAIACFPRICLLPIRGVIDDISKTPYKCNYDQRHIWKLKLDLIGILKNIPKGTKLYSPVCGKCELDEFVPHNSKYPWIKCKILDTDISVYFSSEGKYYGYEKGECMLFPSKYNRDWANFKIPKV